jgi:enamine deaminase RidA (YjgF/YER057c/UK114 family)
MKYGLLASAALLLGSTVAQADIVRYPIPNSTFPIAQAVRVPGDAVTYYVSGQVPPVTNKDADPSSPQAYGDTKTQTVGVLNKIKQILEGQGLGMADVVKMQVSGSRRPRADGLQGLHGRLHAILRRHAAKPSGPLCHRHCGARKSGLPG